MNDSIPKKNAPSASMSLAACFFIFVIVITVLIGSTYFFLSKKNYSDKILSTLQNQSSRIEKTLVDNIEYSAYLMKYINIQIRDRNKRDLSYINKILSSFELKKNTTSEVPWNMFSWVDEKMNLCVNSTFGIVNPISIADRAYAPFMVSDPGVIHFGKPSHGKISGQWIIPSGMGVVDKNGKYIGGVVFGFQIERLSTKLLQSITDGSTTFAIFDLDGEQIMNSENFVSNPELFSLVKNAINSGQKTGELTKFLTFGNNENYGFYRKLEKYPFLVVTKYDSSLTKKEMMALVYPYLFELLVIFIVLGGTFYFLKLTIISPIIQLSKASGSIAQDREDRVQMPESKIAEIVELTNQVKLIEHYKIKLLQSKKMQESFFANISHELRTPLNGILNFSLMMKDEMFGKIDPEYKDMAQDIYLSGKHLLNLVNDILDFSKINMGKANLHEEEFDMNDEIASAIRIVMSGAQYQNRNSSVTITPEITPNLHKFYGDRMMFKQILLNLLSNALKFTESGSVSLKALIDNQENLAIEVEDTGIGIKKEDLEKLGVEFGQVGDGYSRTKYQGSGLGLFLVKKMVELHNGKFELDSVYGQGTKAKITFPKNRLITNSTNNE